MRARVRTIHYQTGHDDEIIQLYKDEILPATKQQPGFLRYLLLNDPDSGKVLSITLWDEEAELSPGDPPVYVHGLASRLGELRDPAAGPPPQDVFEVAYDEEPDDEGKVGY